MKTWILLLGILALLGALPLRAEVDRAGLVAMGASVLKVEVKRLQGGYALGSGVVVGADRIVTNCHVTQGGSEVHVLRGGVRWAATAQARDLERDLCVLRVPGLRADSVPLGRADDLKSGQPLTAIGFTGGLGIQTSAGAVVALHRHDGSRVIQSSNWFSSGASGGGLFDDQRRLVGVLTFRLRGGARHYFSAPAEWLQPLLEDDSRYQPVADTAGPTVSYWQRVLEEQPNFLRAAALERERNWAALQALAADWGRTDTSDPAPWSLQGLALGRLGRLTEAQNATEKSLSLEPGSAPTWYQLGQLLLRQGRVEALAPVRRSLQALEPTLARQFEDEVLARLGPT